MNNRLQKAIAKIEEKYIPAYLHDGDFTVCLLWAEKAKLASFGVTKRNPSADEYNEEFGNSIALARAVKKTMKPKKKVKK